MPLWKPPLYPVVSAVSPLTTTGDNNGLSPAITYASPLLPFYTNGTVIPSTISVSTLNAYKANVQDTLTVGGVGQTLTGAGGELLINGQPLATLSTVSTLITQGTSNWANYPAVSTLQMNGNKMLDVSSISGVAGQTLPILASNVYFGTNGQLTGVSSINGVAPGVGNVADWATFSAVQDVNMNSKNLNSANQVNLNTGGNVVMLTAGTGNTLLINGSGIPYPPPPPTPVPSTITGQNTYMTATGGLFASANSIITAGGGTGGFITATANPGDLGVSGGNVSLIANGGAGVGGLFGAINLTANAGTELASGIATGGAISILANSPPVGLTSKISITAGGLNLYSGVFTPFASVFGYTYINASLGISLVAGGFTSAFQSPGTVYLYGAQGIVLDNGVYANDIQPIWDGNPLNPPTSLKIHGRTAGAVNAPVILENVDNIQMQGAGSISAVKSITGTSGTDLVLDAATGTKLTLTGGSTPLGIPDASVSLQTDGSIIINNSVGSFPITDGTGLIISSEGNVIAFPPSATATVIGSITGLATINGSAYPPVATLPPDPSFSTITFNPGTIITIINAQAIKANATYGTSLITNDEQHNIGLQANGLIELNSYIDGGIQINPEGNTITFVPVPITLVNQGQIVGLSTINGSAYPPPAPSIPPNINFSTITIGTGGDISFSDATGFLRTSAIYGRAADNLSIDASTGNSLALSGGAPAGTAQSLVSLLPDGYVVINNDTATLPITDGTGLQISDEGYTLTFPLDPTGTYPLGIITNLAEINGSAYPPPIPVSVASLNTLSGGLTLTATEKTVVITPGTTDINLYVPSAPYTLSGTTAGAVIVNRATGSGNPLTQNVFTNVSRITFKIPPGWTATDSVSYDGFAFFDFFANLNSYWGVNYFTNTVATPVDILGSTTAVANALTYSNIPQIYIPLNLIIPPTNLSAGGTITLTIYCNPTSASQYITVAPSNTAKIGVVRD